MPTSKRCTEHIVGDYTLDLNAYRAATLKYLSCGVREPFVFEPCSKLIESFGLEVHFHKFQYSLWHSNPGISKFQLRVSHALSNAHRAAAEAERMRIAKAQ